jgi:cbb3-type cytochrome oxidase subunit 3
MSFILSAWTVIVLVLFLGIVAWAWHGSNRADFEDAASIPLHDDEDGGHA